MSHPRSRVEAERTDQAFVRRLCATHAVLRPLLEEHLDDQYGELLPHLLLPLVGDWVEGQPTDDGRARLVVEDIDAALRDARVAGDVWVENVITVSFLEFWPEPPRRGGDWRGAFPAALRTLLRELEPGS